MFSDVKNAEDVLDSMKEAGINPSAETYTVLICGHIKQGNVEKVDSVLLSCEETDICFASKDYYEIIYCLTLFNRNVDKVS